MTKFLRTTVAALTFTLLASTAFAQPYGPGMMRGGPGAGMMGNGRGMCGFGPGFMMGGQAALPASFNLTDAQRAKYDAYQAAVRSAGETARSSCADKTPATTVLERMTRMEAHMATMLTAVETIHPALEDFYKSLDDRQKAAFDSSFGPGMMRW